MLQSVIASILFCFKNIETLQRIQIKGEKFTPLPFLLSAAS